MNQFKLMNREPNRSGGPGTPEGKAKSARNALKFGVYSPTVVLPGESEHEFNALKQQLIDELSPKDTAQLMLVHDLSALIWKKRRLDCLEHRLIAFRVSDIISAEELQDELMFFFPKEREWILDLLDAYTDEFVTMHRHRLDYAVMLLKRWSKIERRDLELMHSECPSLAEFIEARAEYHLLPLLMRTPEGLIKATITSTGTDEPDESFMFIELHGAIDESQQILWGHEHFAELQRGIQKIRDKRLMQLHYRSNTHRLHEELSRAMVRTITDLSKCQRLGSERVHQLVEKISLDQDSRAVKKPGEVRAAVNDGAPVHTLTQEGSMYSPSNTDHSKVKHPTSHAPHAKSFSSDYAPMHQVMSHSTNQLTHQLTNQPIHHTALEEESVIKSALNNKKESEQALRLERLRNRRRFKIPEFTKQTRSQ